jgi:hypothetical protein
VRLGLEFPRGSLSRSVGDLAVVPPGKSKGLIVGRPEVGRSRLDHLPIAAEATLHMVGDCRSRASIAVARTSRAVPTAHLAWPSPLRPSRMSAPRNRICVRGEAALIGVPALRGSSRCLDSRETGWTEARIGASQPFPMNMRVCHPPVSPRDLRSQNRLAKRPARVQHVATTPERRLPTC